MLVGGREHDSIPNHVANGGDVVEAHDLDVIRLSCLFHGGHRTERHVVVAGEDGLDVRMLSNHRCGHRMSFRLFPVAALYVHDAKAEITHCILESLPAFLGIEGGRYAFEYDHARTRRQRILQRARHGVGALSIIGPHERHLDPFAFQRLGIQLVVDVYHHDVLLLRLPQGGNQGPRVGRGDDDGVDVHRNHLFDQRDLLCDIALVFGTVDDEIVFLRVRFLMLFSALGHAHEEFVRERLHDERDSRFVALRGRRSVLSASRGKKHCCDDQQDSQ